MHNLIIKKIWNVIQFKRETLFCCPSNIRYRQTPHRNGRRNNILTLLDMYNEDEHNPPGHVHLDTYEYRMSVTLSLSFCWKLAISIFRIKQKRFLYKVNRISPR